MDWDFYFSALHKFGYGDKFIHMVKDVYNNIQSKIKINGPLSDPFTLTQEVCQGFLFSMFLYIIVVEVLASFINANKIIKGIQIGDHKIRIVNFADDPTIFLRDITCLDRIQVIKFSKSQASAKTPLKYLKLTLVTPFSITPNGTK